MSSPPSRIAVLVVAAVAPPLAGCGSSDQGLLSSKQAAKLRSPLEAARRAVDDHRCNAARQYAQRGAARAGNLSSRVDADLQRNLQQGFNHLVDEINSRCDKEASPTATESPSET